MINMIPLKDFGEGKYLFFVTSRGIVKKSDLLEYVSITRRGIRAINLDDGDELSTVFVTNGKEKVLIATAKGYGISFSEEEVRSMGRVSRGVKGITLRAKDRVVGASSLKHKLDLSCPPPRREGHYLNEVWPTRKRSYWSSASFWTGRDIDIIAKWHPNSNQLQ